MRKILFTLSVILSFLFLACGESGGSQNNGDTKGDTKGDTDTYTEMPDTDGWSAADRPPQPLIKVKFINPYGGIKDYRVIKDPVRMDISESCVSNPLDSDKFKQSNDPESDDYKAITCVSDQSRYRIKYRWELSETPTPFIPYSRITLDDIFTEVEGQWYEDKDYQNPKLAHFTGQRITPTPEGLYYKVKIQAITVDMNTDYESAVTEVIVVPNIIAAARVSIQLTWDKGLDIKAQLDRKQGTAIDLDLHLIKKKSLEADFHPFDKGAEGLMCTKHKLRNSTTGTSYHDDCYFSDKGTAKDTYYNEIIETNKWGAALDIDNTWGGGNFTNPETINLGPIDDVTPTDGKPDFDIYDDEYLIVVNYNLCQDLAWGSNDESCKSDGANYEVTARVDVIIDGIYAPREGIDTVYNEFKIHPNEWIVVSKIKWDQATQGRNYPQWTGDAVVTDNHTDYKICLFPKEECFLNTIPVWDKQKYYDFVTVADTTASYSEPRGTCK